MILGFDPGREKCGVAVMGMNQELHYHQVVPASEAATTIQTLCKQFPIETLVMGDQTTAKKWKQQLEQDLLTSIPIILVDERYSTLEARDRYWQMYPPKSFGRLIPQQLRSISRPIDDIVAIILIERYLSLLKMRN